MIDETISALSRVTINILSKTIHLYSDDGKCVKIQETKSNDFISMCKFINENLTEEVRTDFKVDLKYIY
jgi:hypothetical protein